MDSYPEIENARKQLEAGRDIDIVKLLAFEADCIDPEVKHLVFILIDLSIEQGVNKPEQKLLPAPAFKPMHSLFGSYLDHDDER